MSRPAPKKSSLIGAHPAAPQPVVSVMAATAPAPAQQTEPSTTAAPSQVGRPRDPQITNRDTQGRQKHAGRTATVYFPDEETKERFATAARRFGFKDDMNSLTDLLYKSAERTVREWERQHNEGRPATE